MGLHWRRTLQLVAAIWLQLPGCKPSTGFTGLYICYLKLQVPELLK
jgi:hypothetical protein